MANTNQKRLDALVARYEAEGDPSKKKDLFEQIMSLTTTMICEIKGEKPLTAKTEQYPKEGVLLGKRLRLLPSALRALEKASEP